jgi:hypothetical protein
MLSMCCRSTPTSPARVFQLKIVLSGFRPTVWRRPLVPATTTLDVLRYAIQVAFDWDDGHLHTGEELVSGFSPGRRPARR